MATVRKTITLTEQQDDWIKAQIANGDYTNDSEYVRDPGRRAEQLAPGLRRFEHQSHAIFYTVDLDALYIVGILRTRMDVHRQFET